MKVGVTAGELGGEATGVGTYLEGLFSAVAEMDLDWTWHLHFRAQCPQIPILEDPRFIGVSGSGRFGGVMWEQLELPIQLAQHSADVLFAPAYSLPYWSTTPGVVTIHDLSFECLPHEFQWRERWRRRLLARRASRTARRVIVVSSLIGDQLHHSYGVDRSRIRVVPQGVDRVSWEQAAGSADERELAALGIDRPYLLFVGSLLERRCVRLMLETLVDLRRDRPELKLVFAGANRLRQPQKLQRWIGELGLSGSVVKIGYAPQDSLAALYRFADLSLYLSHYEGFGIPPMESLACGTPAVVGPGLGLDQLWPDYPYRAVNLCIEEVAEVARRALVDTEERGRVLADAWEILGQATWTKVAQRTVAALEEAGQP
ncbi:MAG: glycosyltransferase [bacterium]|nr:glycosyltransferase [bacterium]